MFWTFQLISKRFSIFMCKCKHLWRSSEPWRPCRGPGCRRPVTVEARFRISSGKCGKSGTGTGLSKHRLTLAFPRHYHSTSAPYSRLHSSTTGAAWP